MQKKNEFDFDADFRFFEIQFISKSSNISVKYNGLQQLLRSLGANHPKLKNQLKKRFHKKNSLRLLIKKLIYLLFHFPGDSLIEIVLIV